MDFPKKQQQSLIPRYLLQYLQDLQISHNDPTAPWGGGGGSDYTAGYGIDITNDKISIDQDIVATKNELNGYIKNNDTNYSAVFRGKGVWVKAEGDYTSTSYGDGAIARSIPHQPGYTYNLPSASGTLALTSDIPSLTGYATESWVSSELLDYAELSDLATVATSGSYNDLTNKPTIPDAVSGTNDGTNWTSLTIGSDTYGLASGSTPANMVTTDTTQSISGRKTFTNKISFDGTAIFNAATFGSEDNSNKFRFYGRNPIEMYAPSGSTTGFTLFNSNNYEKGYLQYNSTQDALYLGRWGNGSSPKYAQNIGFLSELGSNGYRVLMPNKTSTSSATATANTYYIPTEITNGTTVVKASSDGIIDISSLISGGGGSYSAGTWINIDSNNSINVSNPYISLLDSNNNPRVMISSTSDGTAPTFTATYCNITPTGFGIVDKTQGSFGGYSAAYTYYRHRDILVNNKWSLWFPTDDGIIATREWATNWVTNRGYSTFSGSYNDLTNKPTIPTISGNYSGSYWTSISINGISKGIPSGGSAPTNMVTTNTDQNITGTKTFVGKQKIRFKQQASSETLGFTAYNNNNNELGNLQIANRTVGGSTYPYVTLGNFSAQNEKAKVGFRIQPNSSSNSYNFVMPYGTNDNFTNNTYSTTADTTIPCAFTDGTTIVKADATGLVNISSISGGGSGSSQLYVMVEVNGEVQNQDDNYTYFDFSLIVDISNMTINDAKELYNNNNANYDFAASAATYSSNFNYGQISFSDGTSSPHINSITYDSVNEIVTLNYNDGSPKTFTFSESDLTRSQISSIANL